MSEKYNLKEFKGNENMGKKENFIKRLTREQITDFLERVYPKSEKYLCSYMKNSNNIYVTVNHNMGDSMFNFTLEEFDSTYYLPARWLKYLYEIFGEEYKQAYLAECLKIFD